MMAALDMKMVGLDVDDLPLDNLLGDGGAQPLPQGIHHGLGDFVLHRKHVGHLPVIAA